MNLYGFVGNNGINEFDVLGLQGVTLSVSRIFLELGKCGEFRLDEIFSDSNAPDGSVIFQNLEIQWDFENRPNDNSLILPQTEYIAESFNIGQLGTAEDTWFASNAGYPIKGKVTSTATSFVTPAINGGNLWEPGTIPFGSDSGSHMMDIPYRSPGVAESEVTGPAANAWNRRHNKTLPRLSNEINRYFAAQWDCCDKENDTTR